MYPSLVTANKCPRNYVEQLPYYDKKVLQRINI